MINKLSSFFRDFSILRKSELDLESKYPMQFQKLLLFLLLLKASNTRFGKKYKFIKILSVKSFQKNIPISHYGDFKKDILEMMEGGENILWPGKISVFTKSSATTAESKYIPISKSALMNCHFKGGKDMVTFYLRSNPNTQLFSGKVLSLCGSLHSFKKNSKIIVGDVSAILTKNVPKLFQLFRFPDPSLAIKENWEKKIDEIAELAIKENITGIIGVPMWTTVLLKKVLEKSQKKSIHEVWPNLEVFMHGGISFKPYRPVFDKLFEGKDIKYIESYNASEGYFAIQDDLEKPNEMRLMINSGVFYEFIPIESYEKGAYNTCITIKDVSLNQNYVIVITTNGGLWRYVIGDTVMFTSLSPLRIKITGRTKQYLNTYDEEISIENVEDAVAYACKETGAQIENFTMCPTIPDKDGKGRHEWVFEFQKSPKDVNIFSNYIDHKMQEENNDYKDRRMKDIILMKPLIHVVPENTFYNWMKKNNRLGGQFKVPRISNSRDHVESILMIT